VFEQFWEFSCGLKVEFYADIKCGFLGFWIEKESMER